MLVVLFVYLSNSPWEETRESYPFAFKMVRVPWFLEGQIRVSGLIWAHPPVCAVPKVMAGIGPCTDRLNLPASHLFESAFL